MSKPVRHHAFTLVELLVATSLSAVLMVAVLHVAAAIQQDNAAMVTAQEPHWLDGLTRVIASDLRSAHDISINDKSLVVETLGVYHVSSQQRMNTPARVRYQLDTDQHLLLRYETDQGKVLGNATKRLMATGVQAFTISTISDANEQDEPVTTDHPQSATTEITAYRLNLMMVDGTTYQRTIVPA